MSDETAIQDTKRKAVREIRWLANSLRGLTALADELDELADIEKEERLARERLDQLQAAAQKLEGVEANLVEKRAELKRVTDDLARVRATIAAL